MFGSKIAAVALGAMAMAVAAHDSCIPAITVTITASVTESITKPIHPAPTLPGLVPSMVTTMSSLAVPPSGTPYAHAPFASGPSGSASSAPVAPSGGTARSTGLSAPGVTSIPSSTTSYNHTYPFASRPATMTTAGAADMAPMSGLGSLFAAGAVVIALAV